MLFSLIYDKNQKMMRLFIQSQQKRALRKLAEIHVSDATCSHETTFQDLYLLVKIEIKSPKYFTHYVTAMMKSELSSENMLKFCILAHIYVQNSDSRLETQGLINFMAYLLEKCPDLIEKYEANEFKRDKVGERRSASKSPSRSCNQSPVASTRSEEVFVCKEVYLVTHIIRTYIGYLMKLFSTQANLSQLADRSKTLQYHQSWMLINYLKVITSITTNFTMIGRYFINTYGHLVILLTKTLARDISKMMSYLGDFVFEQNYLFSTQCLTEENKLVLEFVNMLQQISKLNDELYTVYLGKYFVKYILDVPQPKWIITNSKHFDHVYKAVKKEVPEQTQTYKKGKKRSKSELGHSDKKASKYL